MKFIQFIKSLFIKPPSVKPEPPEVWWWRCINCHCESTGTQQQVETDSTHHVIIHGHAVMGGVRG